MALLFLRNERNTPLEPGEARLSTGRLVIITWRWCSLHATDWEALSHLLIFIACCMVLSGAPAASVEDAIAALGNDTIIGDAPALAAAAPPRQYEPGMVCIGEVRPGDFGPSANAEPLNALWLLLSLGILIKSVTAIRAMAIPFEALSIFVLSVSRILRHDMVTFMLLFGSFVLLLFACLYIVYPRAGGFDDLDLVLSFNTWYEGLHGVVVLGLTGTALPLALKSETLNSLSWWQCADFFLFLMLYIVYILVAITLLLNLLVAMLTFTFDGVKKESTRHSRLLFAQRVLRLEIIATAMGKSTSVGKLEASGER